MLLQDSQFKNSTQCVVLALMLVPKERYKTLILTVTSLLKLADSITWDFKAPS